MYNNRLRNMELPENLFSNLGEMKVKSNNINNKPDGYDNFEFVRENNKFINYPDTSNYRGRISKMYDEINDIKPIDSDIEDVIYFDNYVEKGIVVKPKVSSLKQFWTEYRLIDNEKKLNVEKKEFSEKVDSLDDLFEALSVRVQEINKYIDELKDMRAAISMTSSKLEKDREMLVNERQKFYDYKTKEETKLREEKENFKINFSKLQTIINDLDKRMEDIDKD